MNMGEAKSSIDGKWTGPCKPGQVPGDIVTETGQTINMKAMMMKSRRIGTGFSNSARPGTASDKRPLAA